MTLQVHDELLIDFPPDELDVIRHLVKKEMEQVYPLSVPLVAELGTGPNWRDLEYK
jgi:DNA polymerase-1